MKRMAGACLLGRVEQVADPTGAHAHEHLNELGAVDGVEGHARLAGHGAAQQRLARARRTHQQNALGHAGAQPLELGRIAEKLDHLLQLVLDAFQSGHVGKGDRLVAGVVAPGAALREAARQAAGKERVAGLAEQHPQPDKQPHRDQQIHQQHEERVVGRFGHLVVPLSCSRNWRSSEGSERAIGGSVVSNFCSDCG